MSLALLFLPLLLFLLLLLLPSQALLLSLVSPLLGSPALPLLLCSPTQHHTALKHDSNAGPYRMLCIGSILLLCALQTS